ncbi:MAG: hypothetical protein AUK50_07660 [Comamonadaceae bacterium CG2_30_57_122]|nr:MAG: hypothetical protein AUK50_07660 [Comamonadaceae bacterium CG2_30_57_122]
MNQGIGFNTLLGQFSQANTGLQTDRSGSPSNRHASRYRCGHTQASEYQLDSACYGHVRFDFLQNNG